MTSELPPESAPPQRPNITPAQLVAAVPVVASLLSAFGVYDLSPEQQDALSDAVTYSIALVGGDAIIRFGRNLARR
jgi:hypothetical protein